MQMFMPPMTGLKNSNGNLYFIRQISASLLFMENSQRISPFQVPSNDSKGKKARKIINWLPLRIVLTTVCFYCIVLKFVSFLGK